MKALIQRVSRASVEIEKNIVASIKNGLLVFIGIENSDSQEDIEWLCNKIVKLRIFNDPSGVMNRSVQETGGEIIVVSQFTLHASTKKGARPSYSKASPPSVAIPKYEEFVERLSQSLGKKVQTGRFGADMQVSLINDGPVTIQIDTKNRE